MYSYRKEQHLPENWRCCKGCKGCKAGKFISGQIMQSHHHISFQPRFELKAHVVIVNSHFLNQLSHKAFIIFRNSSRMLLKECFKFIKLLKCTCVCCIFKKEFLLVSRTASISSRRSSMPLFAFAFFRSSRCKVSSLASSSAIFLLELFSFPPQLLLSSLFLTAGKSVSFCSIA